MVILATSSLAFGDSILTPLSFNLIGASDNVKVPASRANITSIDFIQVAENAIIKTDAINFSTGNEDSLNSHSCEVCLVMEGQSECSTHRQEHASMYYDSFNSSKQCCHQSINPH